MYQLQERTLGGDAIQPPPCVGEPGTMHSLRGQMVEIRGEVIDQRRALVIGHGVFSHGHHAGLDEFGPSFKIGQHAPGGVSIAAAGRDFHHDAGPVAILGGVGRRGVGNAFAAVAADDDRRQPGFAVSLSSRQPLAFANDNLGGSRQYARYGFFENGSHLTFSAFEIVFYGG